MLEFIYIFRVNRFFGLHLENSTDDAVLQPVLQVDKPKSCKRGIVYLSHIPEGLTVRNIRELLSKHGEVERIYLERDKSLKKGKQSKKRCKYIEGWVEFKKKSVAKMVAEALNGTQIGGKRRTKFYEALWNIKYLKR